MTRSEGLGGSGIRVEWSVSVVIGAPVGLSEDALRS